jgi:protein-disulfide isomerase
MSRLAVPVSTRDHVRGPVDAALTVVEYGDFQCGHCGLAHPIVTEIANELRDSLRVAFRHFPISDLHPRAQHAAEAAEAAARQGRFWEMHALLYENQADLDYASLLRYAKKARLGTKQFEKDLLSAVHAPRVRADYLGGVRSGVAGAPAFFINGELYQGKVGLDAIVAALFKASKGGSTPLSGS